MASLHQTNYVRIRLTAVLFADGTQVSLSYIVSYRVVENKPIKL